MPQSLPSQKEFQAERQLVTLALFAYNQEQFIIEAIEGVFAQTYTPLEIILSDDCSTDRTFDLMKEAAQAYSGKHRLVLNRNTENLGIGGHLNRIMELSRGELVVIAAGDDISLPHRVQTIFEVWVESKNRCFSIHSAARIIDKDGKVIGANDGRFFVNDVVESKTESLITIVEEFRHVFGATHAWSRDCFEEFGPLDSGITCEDVAIPFRSSLLGEVRYIDQPLIDWRVHGRNLSRPDEDAENKYLSRLRVRRWKYELAKQFQRDIVAYRRKNSDQRILDVWRVNRRIELKIAETEMRLNFLIAANRQGSIRRALSLGVPKSKVAKELLNARFPHVYGACSKVLKILRR